MTQKHPDFNLPWCQKVLSSPDLTWIPSFDRFFSGTSVSNTLFTQTFSGANAIRADISFTRPCPDPGSHSKTELCYLLSIGDAVDGLAGRAHGGFNSALLDQICASCVTLALGNPEVPPATATLTVDYKAPIMTPGVVLCRSWVTEVNGRKILVVGVIEDGKGEVLARSKALFIAARAPSAVKL